MNGKLQIKISSTYCVCEHNKLKKPKEKSDWKIHFLVFFKFYK